MKDVIYLASLLLLLIAIAVTAAVSYNSGIEQGYVIGLHDSEYRNRCP